MLICFVWRVKCKKDVVDTKSRFTKNLSQKLTQKESTANLWSRVKSFVVTCSPGITK